MYHLCCFASVGPDRLWVRIDWVRIDWVRIDLNGRVHPDYHAAAWSGNRLIVGNDGGVWSTTDRGQIWQDHNATLSTLMFFSGSLHPTDPNFILGGLRDFQISIRTGSNNWLAIPEFGDREWGEAEVALSSSHSNTDWMAAWIWGDINRTTDGGKTSVEADLGIDKTASAFVAPVRKSPSNDNVFLTGTNRVWRTDNFFNSAAPTWVPNGPAALPNRQGSPATILTIAYAPSDTTCSTYAYGTLGGQIQLTRDGGKTWTNVDQNNLPARGVNGLAFDRTNPNVLYAAISSFDDARLGKPGHVFKTTNALATSPSWANISPPQDQPFNVIAVDPVNPHVVYAGSDIGLWRSNDGAATWVRQEPDVGMPIAPVYDIQINPATGRTVAFTYGRGAFALGPELVSVIPSPDSGATYAAGPLVPGAWAQASGAQLSGVTLNSQDLAAADPNNAPANLNGVEVRASGVPALLYSVSSGRIAFQVPPGIVGAVTIQVLRDGIPSNALRTTVVPPDPASLLQR